MNEPHPIPQALKRFAAATIMAFALSQTHAQPATECDPDGIPDSFGDCSLTKTLYYNQTGAGAPILDTDDLPTVMAQVESPDMNPVTAATLRMPDNSTKTLTSYSDGFYLEELFDHQAAMDTAYPAGTYQISMTRATPPSPTLVSMTMPPATSYPPIPQIANFAAAQTINPTQNFTLQWNAFTGAAGSDRIVLVILDAEYDVVLIAPDLCIPLPLPNTATSFVLPAGLLEPASTYLGVLTFAKVFYSSTNSPADFATRGALVRMTTFPLNTSAGPVVPQPVFDGASLRMSDGKFQFTLTNLVAGQICSVAYSTTLQSNSWNLLLTTNPPSSKITCTDPGSGAGRRFYRAWKN